jgi:hypothetical protein
MLQKYKLFIDDERFPPDDSTSWLIARSMDEVQAIFQSHGAPSFISFDHDLGDKVPSGHDITKWIVEQDMDHNILPDDFHFYVHSQNPVGVQNIEGYLNGYLKQKFT